MNNDMPEAKTEKNEILFIKEIAKYFMDFLETDFHKRRNPKRSIKLRNESNLLLGVNLHKYKDFNYQIWKQISQGFEAPLSIPKGKFQTNIPANLLDLIKFQIEKVNKAQIEEVIDKTAEKIQGYSLQFKDEYDRALASILEDGGQVIKQNLVSPFIKNLEKPLENLDLGDEGSIYLMEEDLTAVLTQLLENKVSEILKLLISNEKVNCQKELRSVFDIADVKASIISFFENFKVTDLFNEIFELDRNKQILDKQEFYFYFFDITFAKVKYPIFYIPFKTERQNDLISITFDSQIYINKKALEFIAQEYNKTKEKKGKLNSIKERIIYLAQSRESFKSVLADTIAEIIHYFELDSKINPQSSEPQRSKNMWISVSNSSYVCLFDNSDEALINDYEEILAQLDSGNSELGNLFHSLIRDFIHENPKPFNTQIEDEWDEKEVSDRLVFLSPIPLNSEQRQILAAIGKEGCKYITVEGPPGTGKSHTITAILCNAILQNQSVLVLSDKKEALDVVEDKITETMDKVRLDKNFQNPILRLGRTGNTYSQLLAGATIDNIKLHYRAVRNNVENLEQKIQKTANSLKEEIEAEILTYNDIDLREIEEIQSLELFYKTNGNVVALEEVIEQTESSIELEEFRKILFLLRDSLINPQHKGIQSLFAIFNLKGDKFGTLQNVSNFLKLLKQILDVSEKAKARFAENSRAVLKFEEFSDTRLVELEGLIKQYKALKNPLWGYFLNKSKARKLDEEFKEKFKYSKYEIPSEELKELEKAQAFYSYATHLKTSLTSEYISNIDFLKLVHLVFKDEAIYLGIKTLTELSEDIDYLETGLKKYPQTLDLMKAKDKECSALLESKFFALSDEKFNELIRYINLKQKVGSSFQQLPNTNYYFKQKRDVEDLTTTKMTYLLDGRLINFYENSRATAKTLRDIIRAKRRFPRDEFAKLKEAFPCILAGIRDYAEFIPLESNIFDLVIIDEASQVSIAQAFPALIRAKKVLILGDKKQFSNVKASHARSDTNRDYLNGIRDVFTKNVSDETTKLSRLEKFNIKTSILEFFEFIANYNARLLKHFRGYKEIISYSNKHFYQDTLQVMKIRGKKINDVIVFSQIEHDGKVETTANTNMLEAEFILSELEKLKTEERKVSVGIITPHTNQQKVIAEIINKTASRDYFYEALKLKIMTFDTCQGEERDIVYYSMVATKEHDRLWGVFISNLSNVDLEEDGKIKAQRLNVGFSRAKECMNFVLSKPIDSFNGSIGEAIRHYKNILEEGVKEKDVTEVDSKSKMEPIVLNWFYQTDFWKKQKEQIEFLPQFEIGKYLRQLDRTYNHPSFKVDFLLIYKDKDKQEHKIIIEYDGFNEHFKEAEGINSFNYQYYYSDEDLYREKVLESYGYKFLRINKFNSGKNPIEILDSRIKKLTEKKEHKNGFLADIHETVEGLQSGDIKECPKCKDMKPLEDFKDRLLVTGVGKFCNECKSKPKRSQARIDVNLPKCPNCSSSMRLRRGRRGKFYGCSKYPYCKGTKSYK